MQALTDALADVRAAVANGDDADQVLAEIAADYALNPKLIERKLVEAHGADWKAALARIAGANVASAAAAELIRRQEAQKAAERNARARELMIEISERLAANPYHPLHRFFRRSLRGGA